MKEISTEGPEFNTGQKEGVGWQAMVIGTAQKRIKVTERAWNTWGEDMFPLEDSEPESHVKILFETCCFRMSISVGGLLSYMQIQIPVLVSPYRG